MQQIHGELQPFQMILQAKNEQVPDFGIPIGTKALKHQGRKGQARRHYRDLGVFIGDKGVVLSHPIYLSTAISSCIHCI